MTEKEAIPPLLAGLTSVLPPQINDPEGLALLCKYASGVPLKCESATNAETLMRRRAPRRPRGPTGAFLSYSTCTGAAPIPHPQVAPLAPPMGRVRSRVELSDGSKPKPISPEDLAKLELQERALTDVLAQRIQWQRAMMERNYQSRVLSVRHLGPPRKKLKRSRSVEAARFTTLTQATQMVAREVYNGIPEDEINPYAKRTKFYGSD